MSHFSDVLDVFIVVFGVGAILLLTPYLIIKKFSSNSENSNALVLIIYIISSIIFGFIFSMFSIGFLIFPGNFIAGSRELASFVPFIFSFLILAPFFLIWYYKNKK